MCVPCQYLLSKPTLFCSSKFSEIIRLSQNSCKSGDPRFFHIAWFRAMVFISWFIVLASFYHGWVFFLFSVFIISLYSISGISRLLHFQYIDTSWVSIWLNCGILLSNLLYHVFLRIMHVDYCFIFSVCLQFDLLDLHCLATCCCSYNCFIFCIFSTFAAIPIVRLQNHCQISLCQTSGLHFFMLSAQWWPLCGLHLHIMCP